MTALSESSDPKRGEIPRRQLAVFALFVLAVLTLLALGATALSAAFDDEAWLSDHRDRRATLAARPAALSPAVGAATATSALLHAKTAGVAAADLQRRIEAAAHAVGAKTLSSRVDLQDAPDANGALAYVGEIDLAAASLQPLLYDLEAGTPLLEIVDLSARPSPDAGAGERLRVSLSVNAVWRAEP